MKQTNNSVGKYFILVVIFFIPLISNLLHYVVFEHEFGKRNGNLEWVDGSKIHYCDQYLFKIHPAIEVPESGIAFVSIFSQKNLVLLPHEIEVQQRSFFYFNRGPPSA